MLDGVSEPHIEVRPPRFLVSIEVEKGRVETLSIEQLSDGQRAVLALAADLAWRMAQGNPHLENPLMSEAIVLIDEVELHLHPSWQQRVLIDLQRTFPNTQFIVSTHSPQVLTTVDPEHIVELTREDGRIRCGGDGGLDLWAEAGDVLSAVMSVNERPDNKFTRALASYRQLVADGQGESRKPRSFAQLSRLCLQMTRLWRGRTSKSGSVDCSSGLGSLDEANPITVGVPVRTSRLPRLRGQRELGGVPFSQRWGRAP